MANGWRLRVMYYVIKGGGWVGGRPGGEQVLEALGGRVVGGWVGEVGG